MSYPAQRCFLAFLGANEDHVQHSEAKGREREGVQPADWYLCPRSPALKTLNAFLKWCNLIFFKDSMSISHFINIRMTFQFFHINGKFAEWGKKKNQQDSRNHFLHTQRMWAQPPSGKDICHSHRRNPLEANVNSSLLSLPGSWVEAQNLRRCGWSFLWKVHLRFG